MKSFYGRKNMKKGKVVIGLLVYLPNWLLPAVLELGWSPWEADGRVQQFPIQLCLLTPGTKICISIWLRLIWMVKEIPKGGVSRFYTGSENSKKQNHRFPQYTWYVSIPVDILQYHSVWRCGFSLDWNNKCVYERGSFQELCT